MSFVPEPAPVKKPPVKTLAAVVAVAFIAFVGEALLYHQSPLAWLPWVGVVTLAVGGLALVVLLLLLGVIGAARATAGYRNVRGR